MQAILDASDRGELPHGEIALVLSSKPGVYALERAKNHGIPAVVAHRKELGDRFEAEIERYLAAYGIEMIVLAGFMSILSADFTGRWDRRIINVHPALIPSFCGKGYWGLHVHEGDTPEVLQRRVMEEAEWILLPRACEMVAERICGERK